MFLLPVASHKFDGKTWLHGEALLLYGDAKIPSELRGHTQILMCRADLLRSMALYVAHRPLRRCPLEVRLPLGGDGWAIPLPDTPESWRADVGRALWEDLRPLPGPLVSAYRECVLSGHLNPEWLTDVQQWAQDNRRRLRTLSRRTNNERRKPRQPQKTGEAH